MKLSKEQVMVAKGMAERGTSVRQLAGQLGVKEEALRYRVKKLEEGPESGTAHGAGRLRGSGRGDPAGARGRPADGRGSANSGPTDLRAPGPRPRPPGQLPAGGAAPEAHAREAAAAGADPIVWSPITSRVA